MCNYLYLTSMTAIIKVLLDPSCVSDIFRGDDKFFKDHILLILKFRWIILASDGFTTASNIFLYVCLHMYGMIEWLNF